MRTWWRADDLTASALLRLQAPHSSSPLTDRQEKGEDGDDTYTKALHTSARRPFHSDTSGGDGTSDAFAVRTARRYSWRPDARIVHAARLGGQTHPLRGDVDCNGGSRVVWCAGNVCRRAGRRWEQDHKREAREGWPHVLATLARGPLVARLDDQQRRTRGAIHRSARLARFHGQHGHAPRLAEALAASDARYFSNARPCRGLSPSRAERRELPCETI